MIANLFLSFLSGMGLIAATLLLGRNSGFISRASLALPLALSTFALLVIIPFRSQLGFGSSIALLLLISALIVFQAIRSGALGRGLTLEFSLVVALAFAIATLPDFFVEPALSYDSFAQLNFAVTLHTPDVRGEFLLGLASWGFMTISLHSLASYFDQQMILTGLHPLVLTGCALLLYDIARLLTSQHARFIQHASAASVVALWLSTHFVQFNGLYVHNQTLSLLFVLGMLASIARYYTAKQSPALLFDFTLFAMGFALCRIEAPVYLSALLIAILVILRPLPARLGYISLLICGVISAWYVVLFFWIGAGSEILTPTRVLMVLAVLGVAAVFALAHLGWPDSTLWSYARKALFPALALIAVTLSVLDPVSAKTNVHSLVTNALADSWSFTWFIQGGLLIVMIALSLLDQKRDTSREFNVMTLFLFFGVAILTLVFAFGFIRHPYRLGWGDSGNRILVIVLPVFLCASLAWAVVRDGWSSRMPKGDPSKGMAVLVVLALGLSFTLAVYPLIVRMVPHPNLATGASVLIAEDMYPGHGFEEALDNSCGIDLSYTAARESGAKDIVIDLGKQRSVSEIALCLYKKQHFIDFALASSVDLERWDVIYDTRARPQTQTPLIEGDHWTLQANAPIPMRYFKLEYRSSERQNRLLLRGLSLKKKPSR